jgi:nitroreductase
LLHPLLAARWSPTTFDASYELRAPEIEALLEAARWAPSAGNSQPWAFIVGQRGDAIHARHQRTMTKRRREQEEGRNASLSVVEDQTQGPAVT